MIGRIHFARKLICMLFLLFITVACSSQQLNLEKKHFSNLSIVSIKDSIKCKSHYKIINYPFIEGKSLVVKKANNEILEYYNDLWDMNSVSLDDLIKKKINQLEECCLYSGNCQTFDKGYEIVFNQRNLLSIKIKYTSFRGKEYSDYISFNIEEGQKIDTSIFIKEKLNTLLNKINDRLNAILTRNEIKESSPNGEFNLSNLEGLFFCHLNNQAGITFQYVYGFEDEEYDPLLTREDLFFSFEELGGYLSKDFRKLIRN